LYMIQKSNIRFADEAHKTFYSELSQKLKPDVYLRSLIYTLGMCHDTRRNFSSIYNRSTRCINPDVVHEPWQTGSSLKVTRLAFQLFNGNAPSALIGGVADFEECLRYSVSHIFCCSYAPYFFEAIYIRYPEYIN